MVGFPLLLIPLAIYNILAWLMPDVSLTAPLFKLTLLSRVDWQVTGGDILLALGVLLLLLEVVKGARPGSKYLTDHLLSLLMFGGAVAEFVLLPKFGTSIFFLLALMAMVDFFGGIALRVRRVPVAEAAISRRARKQAELPVERQTRIEPAPAMPPPAASIAESVLSDRPIAPVRSANEASPTMPSPELQPGAGPANSPDAPPH